MSTRMVFVIGFLLFPMSLSAQTVNWEVTKRPYFVNDVTGTAVGWHQGTQYSYMIATDLDDRIVYATDVPDAQNWPSEWQVVIPNVTRVSGRGHRAP